ncbi:hypothetical protein BTO11_14265 [Psychrosphaera saromensis]|uniref:Transporter n=1 Tax=Psychrosphaera saromensis TaxID=716813 RepID=A0A2S7UY51_9GAMM|nr:VF530 family protein [Psychrosphaera saromensis]PQJ54699.1 hypothetical protein BTO11_14265 [Psychrosphaera saromensis]
MELELTEQINNPLHGITLQNLLTELVDNYGWEYLAEQVEVRCFMFDPSIKSSLKFLRKTQWARDKIEAIYLSMLEGQVDSSADSSIESPAENQTAIEDPWAQSLNTLQNGTSNEKS